MGQLGKALDAVSKCTNYLLDLKILDLKKVYDIRMSTVRKLEKLISSCQSRQNILFDTVHHCPAVGQKSPLMQS